MFAKALGSLATALALSASGAFAASVDYTSLTAGATSVDGGFWTATASGGRFQNKSQGGWTGTGISGRTGGEIDRGESITIEFDSAVIIDDFILTLLFNGPEYNDVLEVAQVTINDSIVGLLTTTTSNTVATWNRAGATVNNLDPAVSGEGAVWEVLNPFAGIEVTKISFTAVAGLCGFIGGTCGNQSDFSFNSLEYTPVAEVPLPGTLGLLGLGLAGLGAVRRKKAA